MKVVQIKEAGQRDACLARLCAEVYGQAAGLTPLVVFTGVRNVLFKQEVARLLAGVDSSGKPLALVLLVLDEAGEGMTITHTCELDSDGASQRLISELTLKAPLRVDVDSPEQQAFYQGCGIKRWFEAQDGQLIGLSGRHPAGSRDELAATVALDETLILRRFKHDAKAFEVAKQDFLNGLQAFPSRIKA
ncbi:hypothetical protein HW452_12505 [Halomonas aquamarina]|uniref:Uncharacterized protein n=1 Tax=Vreelandella aquamarina TaxID=77097 RepID=A0ACC5VVS4_9GAMM|nr:hypothetical protein [Halomonas aquamarina]MBZ5488345.1 hypothetical protein [Halomonas aquamarina]